MNMRAAVYYGPGDIRLEDYAEPAPTTENLIVKVRCCGLCGTDLKLATIGYLRCHPPRIIGHEMAGEVVHVGTQVQGFALGDRITLATTVSCGQCAYCALGLGNLCTDAKPISYDYDGAMSEYLAVPPLALSGGNVVKLPDNVPDEAAALSEPLSCVINAQMLCGVKHGDKVLIVGGGPLGALHCEVAKAFGAQDVMVVGRGEPRLSLLRKLKGATVIDGATEDVAAIVKSRTGGLGAEVVIVCAPARQPHESATNFVRKGGVISFFASLPNGASMITLDSRAIHYGELRVIGASDSRPEHVKQAVEFLAQAKIDVGSVITHRLPLEEIHTGFALMKERKSLKILLYPAGPGERSTSQNAGVLVSALGVTDET